MKNAEKYIAEPIVASCLVMPTSAAKGIFASAVVGEVAGSAARATSDTITAAQGKDASPLEPGTASLGLLALTADDVVLLNGRRGMLKPVATGLSEQSPRDGLVGAELGKGKMTAPLRLSWADGSTWTVAVPRAETKRARALVEKLAG
jgi:hypothetical protein